MSSPHPPLLLRPRYVRKPWGGRRLEQDLGRRDVPPGDVGESWEAVDLPGVCSIVDGGPLDGRPLRSVLGRPFPLLLKVLDARQDLSVQVHPDGRDGAPAKEEAWVALAPGGAVATGEVRALAGAAHGPPPAGAWLTHLGRTELVGGSADGTRPPSLVHVPPGTVHAILAGALLFEVQNPVDVTWRLDDYGRPDGDGALRPLHLAEARAVLARGPQPRVEPSARGRRLATSRFHICLHPPGGVERPRALAAFFLGAGSVKWGDGDHVPVPAGRTVVLPADVHALRCSGWVIAVSV